eukprot:5263337-Pyramimonas_sp.AAC.1
MQAFDAMWSEVGLKRAAGLALPLLRARAKQESALALLRARPAPGLASVGCRPRPRAAAWGAACIRC